jgi:hypothetical protein
VCHDVDLVLRRVWLRFLVLPFRVKGQGRNQQARQNKKKSVMLRFQHDDPLRGLATRKP